MIPLDMVDRRAAVAPSPAATIARFTVPPRFAHVSFATYLPDPRFPAQAAAVERLRAYLAMLQVSGQSRRGLRRWFSRGDRATPAGPANLYLDGSWGVGKTHLLSSLYHAAPAPKAYLSFRELTYTLGSLGMVASIAAFQSHRLLCIDEFELDDPGNTRLAATFLSGLRASNPPVHVVATSNTIPAELGRGRFAAEDFQHELGALAAVFEVVTVPGEDYRHRRHRRQPGTRTAQVASPSDMPLPWGVMSHSELTTTYETYQPGPDPEAPAGGRLYTSFGELMALLDRHHPIRYAQMLDPLAVLFVEGLTPIDHQDMALRFVHFVDKLYDRGMRLAVSAEPAITTLHDIFLPEFRDKGYAKKYRRCVSRLGELLDDTKDWACQNT